MKSILAEVKNSKPLTICANLSSLTPTQYLLFPKPSLGTDKSDITNQGIGNKIEVYL